jgi:DNA-binding MarR family transcriptional regulator
MKSLERVRRVYRAAREVVTLVDRAAGSWGLTAAELDVLAALVRRAPCRVGTIAAETGHRPSTLTSILDRLADRGWVVRALSPDDRRSFVVHLTAAGRRAAAELDRRLAGVGRALAGGPGRAQVEALARLPARLEAAAKEGRRP